MAHLLLREEGQTQRNQAWWIFTLLGIIDLNQACPVNRTWEENQSQDLKTLCILIEIQVLLLS